TLDDRLVDAGAPVDVVGLDGEDLLEGMGGAVRLESPDLHLSESLSAELRLPGERLLGHERVRTDAARVDLVVHEVRQLEHVDGPEGDGRGELFTRAPVAEADLATGGEAGAEHVLLDGGVETLERLAAAQGGGGRELLLEGSALAALHQLLR